MTDIRPFYHRDNLIEGYLRHEGVPSGVINIAKAFGQKRQRVAANSTYSYTTTRTKTKTQNPRGMYNGSGVYNGRFKRVKPRIDITKGVVFKRTDGFNVADDNGGGAPTVTSPVGVVYTGVTAVVERGFQYNVLLAILRVLCRSKGFEFNSPDDQIKDTTLSLGTTTIGSFHYTYRQNGNNTPVTRSFVIPVDASWYNLAVEWYDNMDANFSAHSNVFFDKCMIFATTDEDPSTPIIPPIMSLNMRALKINYESSNTLYVQNRTKDAGGGDDVETIDANPLRGRLYEINSTVVQMGLQGYNPGVTFGTPTINSGVFFIEPQKWTANEPPQRLFARPPPKSMFRRCYKTSSINLQPGEIKKATVSLSDFTYFDKLFAEYFLPIFAATITAQRWPIQYGKSIIMGFEKVVRTATVDSTAAFDSRIQLACTTAQYLKVEAFPVRRQAFIAQNINPEVS